MVSLISFFYPKHMRNIFLALIIFNFISCDSNYNNKPKENKNYISLLTKRDSLAIQLIQLYGSDQVARRNNRLFAALDSINFDCLVQFIEKNGYPTSKLMGEKYMKLDEVGAAAGAILLHNPHKLVNEKKYFDFF